VNLYDKNRATKVFSVASNDTTPELWTIQFQAAMNQTIDAIFIDNHNIKSGNIKYWDGTAFVNFSTPVTWSNNTQTTSFFSFTSVATSKIQLTMNTTMIANAQKFVGQLMLLESIGAPQIPPSAFTISYIDKGHTHTTVTGGVVFILYGRKATIKLTFSDASYTDIDLFEGLKTLGEPFVFYPNGGAYSGQDRGFRLKDIYTVNYMNDFLPVLKSGVLDNNQTIMLELKET
jgi:hypothetical protein